MGLFIAQSPDANYSQEDPIVICTMAIDRDQLVTRLDEIKARARNSIELSRRMIDHSFLCLKATHRNLYALQRSVELLNALPKTTDLAMYRELTADPAETNDRAVAINSLILCYACNSAAQTLGPKTDEVRKFCVAEQSENTNLLTL